MSFHLVHADAATLLASDRPVVKRAERVDFTDAVDLLRAAAAIREQALAETEAARREGHRQGFEAARGQAEEHLADRIAAFAAAIDRYEDARRGDIAAAAHAAVRAIVGELDDADLVPRVVERTLARLSGEGPVTVLVAPGLADPVAARLDGLAHVTVAADPGLDALDCVVRTSAGQVIASLSVQLDALAKRWGLDA